MEMKAHLKLPNHHVHIQQDEQGLITIFKYNNRQCAYEQFTDTWAASDFIMDSLPTYRWEVHIEND